jgi:1,4-dihydroxy-2-naphthoate octaprenyltransferase
MASIGTWIQAARPRTLPASVAPVAVGTALAAGRHPQWLPALACLGGALLIQIGCNFANDAFDALKGADSAARVGPQRAVASGLISPRAMLAAATLVLALAFGIGLYLTAIAGWPILALGVVSIACAILYTGGPFPLAYHGLGDLFVFLFFGLAAVIGTYEVQRDALTYAAFSDPWPVAAAIGLQCTAIIVVNNLRDIPTDTAVGKRTLAVRLGDRATRQYYGTLHGLAASMYACYAIVVDGLTHALLWLPVAAALIGGILLTTAVSRAQGAALNRFLGLSAALEMLTGVLLVIALIT